jgi:mono/diheme cytochrome c family protein
MGRGSFLGWLIRSELPVLVVVLLTTLAAGPKVVSGFETTPGQAAKETVWGQIYTEEQAVRGRRSYETECESCHLENLRGDGYAPALAGSDFSIGWTGLSVGDLFGSIEATMPQEDPGGLSAEVYIDIVAYLLSKNHMPAGDAELQPDTEALQKILITERPEG